MGFLSWVDGGCFSDTPGMNAAATVLLAFLRPIFLRLFVPRDTLDTLIPAARTMGIFPFLKYLVVCVLVHHGMLLTLEFFPLPTLEHCC